MSPMKDAPLRSAEQLGMAVRLKRREKGLSQSALAELLGVERKWVLRLEAGNPKAEFALVLKALELVGIRAILHDEDRALKKSSSEPSRLDEVFSRLQRRDTK
jgi:transcriptional regulator with XRE-family HTH domain